MEGAWDFELAARSSGAVPRASRTVSLALQGGSSMGAYAWGVLDALLEDGRLEFEGVTGTSAGAINAVALADGLAANGRAGARSALRAFWEGFARAADERRMSPAGRVARASRRLIRPRAPLAFQELVAHAVTDFRVDPASMEPIRSALEAAVDFERLRRSAPMRVFVNATNVRTQEMRIFAREELTADAVLASACIPILFQAVEIEGEPYWDGSFLGNPAIFPVLYNCRTSDVLLIETRPATLERPPTSAGEILSRMMTLGARAALVRELRMIDFVSELVRKTDGAGLPPGVREIRLQRVEPNPALGELKDAGSFRVEPGFFHELFGLGREAGKTWLARHLTSEGTPGANEERSGQHA